MIRRLVRCVLACFGALALAGFAAFVVWQYSDRSPVRRFFAGAVVLTMDPSGRMAEAVAVEDGRIVAVGSNAEIRALAGPDAVLEDLGGRTLLPGFIDAHGHFPGTGLGEIAADLGSPPVGDVRDVEDAIRRLRARAEETSKGDWVVGFGYDDFGLAERRQFTRADLDRVAIDRPVFVLHISGHTGVVNSLGLQRLGIDATTPDPPGGVIRRDPRTGEPDGRLDETAVYDARRTALALSLRAGIRVARAAARDSAAHGVTTAQVGLADPAMFSAMARLARFRLVPLRLIAWPDETLGEEFASGKRQSAAFENERFDVGAVKLVADGSIYIHTAYLRAPYATPPPDGANERGSPIHRRDELVARVKRFHAAGLQVAIHGNGDAAIDDILAAFDAAQAAAPRGDPRFVVVHAQMAQPDQLERMVALGVTPTFHVPHTFFFADRHRDVFLGPERTARISPLRSARDRGLRFSVHSDAPVFPIDPLMAVWCAVNRVSAAGVDVGPEERITPYEALRAVTIDAAWQVFHEGDRGSIEVGKYADLVVLEQNPLEHPRTIREIRVRETIVGGRTIFRAGE